MTTTSQAPTIIYNVPCPNAGLKEKCHGVFNAVLGRLDQQHYCPHCLFLIRLHNKHARV